VATNWVHVFMQPDVVMATLVVLAALLIWLAAVR
jgi:hypothetical protein